MREDIVDYMVNKKWENCEFESQKLKVLSLLRNINPNEDIVVKLGKVLLCIQMEELLLKEAIIISNNYIRAEIWPSKVDLNINLNDKTFGGLITYFKNNSIEDDNKSTLIKVLYRQNNLRNHVIHKLFENKNLNLLNKRIDRIIMEFEFVLAVLLEYYNTVCWKLYDLSERVDFSQFL